MSSAIHVLNGFTDISSGIDWRSVDMTAVVTKEKGSFKFDMINANSPSVPSLGDTIYLKYNGTLLFGGTCTEKQTVMEGGKLQRYKITCMDGGYIFDSNVVHKTYQNMDPSDIVKDIVTKFAPASFNNVQKGNF